MDNLAHTLSGLLLRRAGLGRDVPWAGPVLAISANLPDAELIAVGWMDRAGYLEHHRGITHSLAGAAPQALLFAAAVCGLGARFLSRPPAFRPVFLLSLAGVLTHLLLDGLNTYGLRLWLPFSGAWLYGDLAFIVDPWIWLLLGGGAALGGPLSRRAAALWLAVALLASAPVLQAALSGIVPAGVPVVWFLGIAALVGAAFLRRPASPRPARLAAAAFALYLVALFAMGRAARENALDVHRGPAPEVVSINPLPGVPWRFQITLWTPRRVERYRTSAFGGAPQPLPPIESGLDDPALDALRDLPELRSWRSFARQPVARREGGALVLGDARYRLAERADWTEIRIPLN